MSREKPESADEKRFKKVVDYFLKTPKSGRKTPKSPESSNKPDVKKDRKLRGKKTRREN